MIRTVGIWGHFHGKNLGDDVVVATLIENLRTRIHDVEVMGFSLDPDDTSRRHGIHSYSIQVGMRAPVWATPEDAPLPTSGPKPTSGSKPMSGDGGGGSEPTSGDGASGEAVDVDGVVLAPHASPPDSMLGAARHWLASTDNAAARALNKWASAALSLWRMRQALQGVDLLIVAGSGPFFDGWDGAWNHPFNLFSWSQLARTTGTRFVPLSVGGGPIDERITRFFLRHTLNASDYKSYRDPYSARLAREIGARGPHPLFPDLAFGLSSSVLDAARANALDVPGEAAVGVSTMAYKDPRHMPRGTEQVYRAYLAKLTDVTAWLLDADITPVLLRSDRGDDRVADDLVASMRSRNGDAHRILVPPTETHHDLLAQMAACDVVVGGRFHCHVLPFLLDVPVLGLAYHPKTSDMMAYMGQSDFCLDIDRSDATQIIDGLQTLLRRRDTVSDAIHERVEQCRDAVALQYDALVGGTTDALHGSFLPAHDPAPAVAAR